MDDGPTVSLLLIDAIVSPREAEGVKTAAQLLKSYLNRAGGAVDVRLRRRDFASPEPAAPDSLVVLSMSGMVDGDAPLEAAARSYAERIEGFKRSASAGVCLLTVFQHVAGPQAAARRSRIRRANLAAARLSHATGASVADVDRALSLFGARELRTDCDLGGVLAPEVVAHVLVQAWLSLGLGPGVPEALQAEAWEAHGGMAHMKRLERRLSEASA